MKMMKSWRYVITGVTTAALMSFGALSLAETTSTAEKDCTAKHQGSHRHGGPGKSGSQMRHLAKALELTAEQKQTLAAHKDEQRATRREQRKQLHQTQHALHKAVANNANEVEIVQLANQVGDLTAQQIVNRAREKQFLLSILTEEQKEKMEQVKAERKSGWRKEKGDPKA